MLSSVTKLRVSNKPVTKEARCWDTKIYLQPGLVCLHWEIEQNP